MNAPQTARPAKDPAAPIVGSLAGHNGSLNGHMTYGTQPPFAVEGQNSPQATSDAAPKPSSPAGNGTAQPANGNAIPTVNPLAGHQAGRDQNGGDIQRPPVPAAGIPGAHSSIDTHAPCGTGEQAPPAANVLAAPKLESSLAAHLLVLAAKEVDELEHARIATNNRLFQVVSDRTDKDGKQRGFGLMPPGVCAADDKDAVKKLLKVVRALVKAGTALPPAGWDTYVWKLALLAVSVEDLEAEAVRQLEGELKKNPLWPWIEAQAGIGAKQAARLLGAIGGDPLIRPEIIRNDGTVEPARRRMVSELISLCGHGDPERRPRKGMSQEEAFKLGNPEAKKRLRVIAMQCVKFTGEPDKKGRVRARSPYRDIYDAARGEYSTRLHGRKCQNAKPHWMSPNGCGTSRHPEWGAPGSPWRDGHIHHAALRKAGKQFIKDLYREAERLHEEAPVSGHRRPDTHAGPAADGPDIPAGHTASDTQTECACGEQDSGRETAA